VLHHLRAGPAPPRSRPLVGGYLFIAVSGLLYVAFGVFASSLTRSQAVSRASSAGSLLIALTIGPGYLSSSTAPELRDPAAGSSRPSTTLQVFQHVDDFTHGVVDTRQTFFYLSGAALALIFSMLGVEAKLLQG
jgi:ABC-2 type transport system permease protein